MTIPTPPIADAAERALLRESKLVSAYWWLWSWGHAIVSMITCWIVGHDWHEGELTRIGGGIYPFQCCMRCEKTEDL